MTALQWVRNHLWHPSAADQKCAMAMALTDEVTEAVRSRKYPDPFSPIIQDMQRHRAVSEYDQAEASEIYETKVPK